MFGSDLAKMAGVTESSHATNSHSGEGGAMLPIGVEQVRQYNDRISDLTMTVNALADRLFGDRPTTPTGSKGEQIYAPGMMGELALSLEMTRSRLRDLNDAIERLRTLA